MLVKRHLSPGLLALPAAILLVLGFLFPLARFFELAFLGAGGPFAAFTALAESEVYREVFLDTLIVAVVVTGATLLLAWPVAYLLTRLEGVRFVLVLYGVLLPLWISVLVRTFSWMLLLERNGPINRALKEAGLTAQPLALLFNTTGELVGMVHVLLPYAILPLYAAMSRIDPRLLLASDGLGASLFDTFRHIYFPLSLPGLLAGAMFVFLLSLGFFITPALLGGPRAMTVSMLIASFVTDRLAWDMAAAASLVLLATTLAVLWLFSRLVPLGRQIMPR
jgi:ABC-type spermidine/putrescine transport system permease subunit I